MTITIKLKNGTPVQPELVEMFQKAHHKAHGTKGFADPDVQSREVT